MSDDKMSDDNRYKVLYEVAEGCIVGFEDGALGFSIGETKQHVLDYKMDSESMNVISLPAIDEYAIQLRVLGRKHGNDKFLNEQEAPQNISLQTVLLLTLKNTYRLRIFYSDKVWVISGKAELLP
jgi:hypothetical protein